MILKNMEKIKNSNFVSPQNAPEPEEDMTSVCSCDCTSCNPFYSRYASCASMHLILVHVLVLVRLHLVQPILFKVCISCKYVA